MTRRLSRKSALRLMMVGGGLMAATPAAVPQGAIIPSDMDRAKFNDFNSKNKGVTIPCCAVRAKNKGAKIPCCTVRSNKGTNKGQIPPSPCGVRAMNPCELKNKGGVVGPNELKNKGQIPGTPGGVGVMNPCELRNKGGLRK